MNLRSPTLGALAILLMTSQAHAATTCESLKFNALRYVRHAKHRGRRGGLCE
jgi:hypothetical protein